MSGRGLKSPAVDGDIICDVARSHGMGAGGLKGLLVSPHADELTSRELKAVKEAQRRQAERDGLDWGDDR